MLPRVLQSTRRVLPIQSRFYRRTFGTTSACFRAEHPCWKCSDPTPVAAVLCQHCGTVQPVNSHVNLFELTGAGAGEDKDQPVFDVNVPVLRRNFLKLQQQAHPDSYSQAEQKEHQYAQTQSAIINKAYHTLRDPLARAQYMLGLKGQHVDETESLHDPELLMEIMEFREELEEASTEDEVAELKQRNDEQYQETVQNLSAAFASNDLDQAKEYMIQLQYWENIRRAIVDWAPGKRVEIKH